MATNPEMKLLADELALKRLIVRYAQACDRRDVEAFAALFTSDAVLEGPGFRFATPEQIRGVPQQLRSWPKTYHTLLNFVVDVSGDRATGEAYSMAHHLTPAAENRYDDFLMYITYRDQYRRSAEGWQFERRQVVVEFTESKPVAGYAASAEARSEDQ